MSSVEIVHGNHIFTFMCSVSLVNVCEAIAAGVWDHRCCTLSVSEVGAMLHFIRVAIWPLQLRFHLRVYIIQSSTACRWCCALLGIFFIRQVDIWTTRRASSTLVNLKHLCGTVSRFLQVLCCSLQVEGEVSKQAENRIGRQQKSRNGNKIKRGENTGKEEMKGVGKSRQGERKRTLRTEAKRGWCTEQCGLSVVLPEKEFLNQHSLFFTDPSPLCHTAPLSAFLNSLHSKHILLDSNRPDSHAAASCRVVTYSVM